MDLFIRRPLNKIWNPLFCVRYYIIRFEFKSLPELLVWFEVELAVA